MSRKTYAKGNFGSENCIFGTTLEANCIPGTNLEAKKYVPGTKPGIQILLPERRQTSGLVIPKKCMPKFGHPEQTWDPNLVTQKTSNLSRSCLPL